MARIDIEDKKNSLGSDYTFGDVFTDIDLMTDEIYPVVEDAHVTGHINESIVYCDSSEVDQGVVGSGRSLKDLIDAAVAGGSRNTVIVLSNNSGNVTTTYTLTTSEEIPSHIFLKPMPGAIIDGAGTLTVYSSANIISQPNQQIFGSSITVQFTIGEGTKIPVEWWGTDDDAIIAALTCASSSAGTRAGDESGESLSLPTVTLSTDVSVTQLITQPQKTIFTMAEGVNLIRGYNGDLWKIATSSTRIGRIQFDCSQYDDPLAADSTACFVINTSTGLDNNLAIEEIKAYGNDYPSGDAVRGAVFRIDADQGGKDDFYYNRFNLITAEFFKYLFYWNVTEDGGTAGVKGNIFGPMFINRIPYIWYDNLSGTSNKIVRANYFGPIIYEGGNSADYLPVGATSIFEFDTANNLVVDNIFNIQAFDVNTGTLFDLEGSTIKNTAYVGVLGETYLGAFNGSLHWIGSSVPSNLWRASFNIENLSDDTAGQTVLPVGHIGSSTYDMAPYNCYVAVITMFIAGTSDTGGTIRVYSLEFDIDHTFTLTNGTQAYRHECAYSDAFKLTTGEAFRLKIETANLNVATEDAVVTLWLAPMKV